MMNNQPPPPTPLPINRQPYYPGYPPINVTGTQNPQVTPMYSRQQSGGQYVGHNLQIIPEIQRGNIRVPTGRDQTQGIYNGQPGYPMHRAPIDQAQTNHHLPPRDYSQHDKAKNALSIAKRFSYKDQKFSGSEEENTQEYIAQYMAVCTDLEISPQEKNQFAHNIFRGEALRFYNALAVNNYKRNAIRRNLPESRWNYSNSR